MRVLIVGEVRVYRETLALLLGREERVTVVGTCPPGPGTGELVARAGADVVLVEAGFDQILACVEDVVSEAPAAKIVALAVPESEPAVMRLVEEGVSALVPAEASAGDLVQAVTGVQKGEAVCPPRVTAVLLDRLRGLTRDRHVAGTSLTSREVEVTRLIDQGLSNKEIAARLSIAVPTVKNHIHNILGKLGVGRRSEAAAKVWGGRHAGRSRF